MRNQERWRLKIDLNEWPWQNMIGMPLCLVGKRGITGNKYRQLCKGIIDGGRCKTKGVFWVFCFYMGDIQQLSCSCKEFSTVLLQILVHKPCLRSPTWDNDLMQEWNQCITTFIDKASLWEKKNARWIKQYI